MKQVNPPFIQNVSMSAVSKGLHYYVPHKTALIQIQDYYGVMHFAEPIYPFVKVLQLRFDDDDVPNLESNITQLQAKAIGDFLKECLEAGINVVVHCHAGLCRSGAVVECGISIGFQDLQEVRWPNNLVYSMILKEL
jgi:protein-tyrosine phosphatase